MADISIKKIEYKGWKNCVEVSNGIVDLVATTDVGPRVIRFGFAGGKNEFCEVAEDLGTVGGDQWKMYGGHRLWHSPEIMPRTYFPDNGKVAWRRRKNGIVLDQPVESTTGIKKDIEITMSPDEAKVTLVHRLTNMGAWAVELAAWPITVMAPGGREIIPQVKVDTGLLPNRMVALWPYSKMNDPRVYWGERYMVLKQDSSAKTPFKIGVPNLDGWAGYVNGGHLFVKRHVHIDGALYPDYGSSYETYTCNFMLEMESLSPLAILEPGESLEHMEEWLLFSGVETPETEEDIDRIILPLLK